MKNEVKITKEEVLKYLQETNDEIENHQEQLQILGSNDIMDEWDYHMDENKKLHGVKDLLNNWLLPRFK